jgi:TolA-binding protein
MDRQHRRDLRHDKFVDEIGTLSTRARENQRLLTSIAVAAVVVALLGYGYYFYRADREKKAQAELATAIRTMESPLLSPQTHQEPSSEAKYKTEAERTAAAEKSFRSIVGNYGSTDAADISRLYLARIEGARGNTSAARSYLQQFISDHPKHMLVGSARYSLYQLRIEAGEAPQVVAEINTELAKSDPVLPADTLLVTLAHAYNAQGNDAKSRETYRRIATEFPDSPYALEAQRRIGPA